MTIKSQIKEAFKYQVLMTLQLFACYLSLLGNSFTTDSYLPRLSVAMTQV